METAIITWTDTATSKETPITTNGSAYSPDIYGDRIVWEDWRNGNGDIYMYDIATSIETQITTSGLATKPMIYGDRIAWQDNRSGNWDISRTISPLKRNSDNCQ